MCNTSNKPLLYGIELRSDGYYNSGYLRHFIDQNNLSLFDGLFTDEYFSISLGKFANDDNYFIVLTIFFNKDTTKYYQLLGLDPNAFSMTPGVLYPGIAMNNPNDVIYIKLLDSIDNPELESKIIPFIEAAQKTMTSP